MHGVERHCAIVLAALGAAFAVPAAAQNAEAPRAPRILDPAAPRAAAPASAVEPEELRVSLPSLTARRPPNAARLAPLPEERNDAPDEIIVIGQGWRLPDLGSEWRARQKESRERRAVQRNGAAALRSGRAAAAQRRVLEPRAAAARLHRAVSAALRAPVVRLTPRHAPRAREPLRKRGRVPSFALEC
jgi:hypothetical protein